MAQSDFNLVPINHKFTVTAPTKTVSFPIEGTQTPVDDGYLVIQVKGVQLSSHQVKINGIHLGGSDLLPAPLNSQAWLCWMDRIQPNVLKAGGNDITITRIGDDDFEIGNVVVNWRENA